MQKEDRKAERRRKKELEHNRKNSPVGGQAVMEGVMMKGVASMAVAVRDADGIIRKETKRIKPTKEKNILFRLPIIRGVINFFSMMVLGVKTLLRSAEVYGEEEPTRFEKWVAKKFKINLLSVVISFSVVLAVVLAVGLFIVAPRLLTDWISYAFETKPSSIILNLIDGGIRLAIFIIYLALVSLLKDIRRVFMYHGAEHKTINCYEQNLPLTVENVKGCSTLHQRCGTTFMFFVMVISILMFSLLSWGNIWVNIALKIALFPVVAGLSYELLKLLAKTNSPLVYPFKVPGLLLQRMTTKQPTDDMLEVAITSFNLAMEMDSNPDMQEISFDLPEKSKPYFDKIAEEFGQKGIDTCDVEWIFADVLNLKRSELFIKELITVKQAQSIRQMADRRLNGEPLQHILGSTEFYGYKIKTDRRALIPRLDTEVLAEQAIKVTNKHSSVLDLCTGTGCIAIAIAKQTGSSVTAVDISDEALQLAEENAKINEADISFIKSDMFSGLEGNTFDVIVSNPPYIKREEIPTLDGEVKDYEPHLALDGGESGFDAYEIIAKNAEKYIKSNGVLLLEVGIGQAQTVAEMFSGKKCEIIKDLNGVERIVIVKFAVASAQEE